MTNGGGQPGGGGIGDGARNAADEGIGAAVGAVPDDPLKTFLTQAGWLGLFLGVLLGNVPVTLAITKAVSGKAVLDSGMVETYFRVFVLVTPWVALVALLVYFAVTDTWPVMSGPGYCFAFGLLVAGAGYVSVMLGGVVPPPLVDAAPSGGGPSQAATAAANTLGGYFELYGPIPIFAGVLEGGFFGYWLGVLSKS